MLEFLVNTNVDFEVSVSKDWIKQNTFSRGLVEKELSFFIGVNNDRDSREGEIVITFEGLKQTIKVTQYGSEYTERMALIEFYKATGGDEWTNNKNWCSDKPLSEWYGITTTDEEAVMRLDLLNNNLKGTIPTEIGDLKNLIILNLDYNQLSGTIPDNIGNLTALQYLRVGNNQLSGSIPDGVGKLINLREIAFYENQFSGDIAHITLNLTKLELLSLSNNNFTGELPEFSDNMDRYNVNNNSFTGSIPESHIKAFDRNPNINTPWNTDYGRIYKISWNNLSGEVPAAMVNHRNWVAHWREVMPQNQGYGFNRVDLPAPQIVVKCYDDSFLDLAEEYRKNQYTIIFRWDPYCHWSNLYVQPIYQLYQKYKDKGLGLITTTHTKFSVENMNPLISIYKDIKVFWEVSEGQGAWDNNPMGLGSYFFLFRTGATPYFHVVDNSGNIVFYGSGDGGAECIPQYHENRDDIYDFVANLFGDEKYEE